MKSFSRRPLFGYFFAAGGVLVFLAAVVLPYSRIFFKSEINLADEDRPNEGSDFGRAVFPVFSGLRNGNSTSGTSQEFYLTIEKLGIWEVPVKLNLAVNNQRPDYLRSLSNAVGHLKGTSLPGERGNSLIFGHSALSYLYNPKNFQTIFSKIDELSFGDLIKVRNGRQNFLYRVEKGGLIDGQAGVADFSSTKPRLTLLSCYPPGFNTKRYVVRSVLANENL